MTTSIGPRSTDRCTERCRNEVLRVMGALFSTDSWSCENPVGEEILRCSGEESRQKRKRCVVGLGKLADVGDELMDDAADDEYPGIAYCSLTQN